jgi:phenylalanyl-tRNA synthetase alpha chain
MTSDPANNVPESIWAKLGVKLHTQADHPLCILKTAIHAYFDQRFGAGTFAQLDDLHPLVSVQQNFDQVLVPPDHVSRSPNDTYYVDSATVLRCHTSAHQVQTLAEGRRAFLITGDVYRRDAIDATHYPVFHQMEGVRVLSPADWQGEDATQFCAAELKSVLEGLARHLFGPVEVRWVDAYFPFTTPSFEMEIFFNGQWLEVLGCGVMQQSILEGAQPADGPCRAWAFGLGLERLAMVLFGIPDIRLFWSSDERFTRQFKAGCFRAAGAGSKFSSFSKYPPCLKDVSFWLPPQAAAGKGFSENNLCEVVRSVAGDLVEEVRLVDQFTNAKTGKSSACYRVVYRSMERSLTDEEINGLQEEVRRRMVSTLQVELR